MGVAWQRMKKWWEECLGRLSKANKESFGGSRMDCCSLGKTPGNKTRH